MVFVAGAIGVEMVGAASKAGTISLVQGRVWLLQVAVEEGLEKSGVVLLIRALLLHLEGEGERQVTT